MTYEYVCTACGHAWEAEQSISAAPLKTCPSCNAESAKRQVSGGAGFILKGGGWYADLYGSAPKKSEASADGTKESKGDAAKKESGSSDTTSKSSDSGSSSSGSSSSSTSSSTSGSSGSSGPSGSKPAGTPSAA